MTSRRASARAAIKTVARALAGESPPAVFVGGTITALYPLGGGVDVRPTLDVDCVVDLASTGHDLEDVLTVLAGLPALRDQIARDDTDVARALRAELVGLRANEAFIDAVPAHFEGDATGQARADEVLAWLPSLAAG